MQKLDEKVKTIRIKDQFVNTHIRLGKFLRLNYSDLAEFDKPYTQIVLLDQTKVRNLKDIKKYLKKYPWESGGICNLILLKEGQQLLKDHTKLCEIQLDSLKVASMRQEGKNMNDRERNKRMVDQIQWLQEAIESQKSNNDFVSKIQFQLNQNSELEYPRNSALNNANSGLDGHISIQDSLIEGDLSDEFLPENNNNNGNCRSTEETVQGSAFTQLEQADQRADHRLSKF